MSSATPDEHAPITKMLARWGDDDRARALHAADRDAVRATEPVRSLVLELLFAGLDRDLFNACARLGMLMAEAGASPSLAAGSIDAAKRALDAVRAPYDAERIDTARAAFFEGFAAAVRSAERASALVAWDYPACAVPLADGRVAIACGFPSDDREALAGWAARVTSVLLQEGVRGVVLAGSSRATTELADALQLAGITVGEKRSRFRLPWQR
jgi:hypothetical protein